MFIFDKAQCLYFNTFLKGPGRAGRDGVTFWVEVGCFSLYQGAVQVDAQDGWTSLMMPAMLNYIETLK